MTEIQRRRIDIMVDIETLGTESNSTIFQIAAGAFDIFTGELFTSFNSTADISLNAAYDMSVTGSTLKWWVEDPGRAKTLAHLLKYGKGDSATLIEDFHKWLTSTTYMGEIYLWGNGILFDNLLLQEQFKTNGLDDLVHFRNHRDVRTIIELAAMKTNTTAKEYIIARQQRTRGDVHDAYADMRNQIDAVVDAWAELMGSNEEYIPTEEEELNLKKMMEFKQEVSDGHPPFPSPLLGFDGKVQNEEITSTNTYALGQPKTTKWTFNAKNGTEMLRLEATGDIFMDGELMDVDEADDALRVMNRLREFAEQHRP